MERKAILINTFSDLMRLKGINYKTLAAQAGVEISNLRKLVKCSSNMTIDSYTKLAASLGFQTIIVNMDYNILSDKRIKEFATQYGKYLKVIADERIRLKGIKVSKQYPEKLRMVTYEDYATSNVYRFLTNNTEYEALTIAEL